jgi:hypothetical protein
MCELSAEACEAMKKHVSAQSEIVVDLGLVRLIGKWGKSKSSTDRSWTKITEYAARNGITRTQLRLALLQME